MKKPMRTTKQASLDKEKILHFLSKENDSQHNAAMKNFKRKPYGTIKRG